MSHGGRYPTQTLERADPPASAELRAAYARLVLTNKLLCRAVVTLQGQLRASETLLPQELRCGHCRRYLPLVSFTFDRTRKSGRRGWCRECDRDMRTKGRFTLAPTLTNSYDSVVGSSDAPHANIAATPFGSLTLSNGVVASRGQG